MTKRALAAKIAKLEGKKSQARIGDIMEILSILIAIEATTSSNAEHEWIAEGEVNIFFHAHAQKLLEKAKKTAAKGRKRSKVENK